MRSVSFYLRGFACSALLSAALCAEEAMQDQGLAPVRVEDMREQLERAGKLKDTIQKTEVINERKIERKQAKTLTEAVQNEPGIDAATGCSICGMKRIQINGLRGEYTTVLVDDVPIHSTVSSYYGMDALTTAGIARIEVARGAGASLLAPGALGGVINIVSQKAVENGLFLDTSGGNALYRTFSLVGNAVSDSGKRRSTVSAQYNHQGQWDSDGNGVNESPQLSNYTFGLRLSDDLGTADNVDLRIGVQRSDVLGGPIVEGSFGAVLDSGNPGFVDGDVRKRYNGALAATMETIATDRYEATGKWTHRLSDAANTTVTLSGVHQAQDSFYESADYSNGNDTLYFDTRANYQASDYHLWTFGADFRGEILRAKSHQFFEVLGNAKDDFDSLSAGLYLQETWTPSPAFELSTAVRLDRLGVDWKGQTAKGYEIDTLVPVPRVHMRWNMSQELVSRFSVGRGYRAPLTFFESEHGILDEGFNVHVSSSEQSSSAVYSLSYDDKRTTATASLAWTNIEQLAYVNFHHPSGKPTLMNDPGQYDVYATDVVAGYQLTPSVTLGASYEHFF
ncbi:TonB-dependent receptor, partial [bacterium]|nr:TonB-dependent receptor [bacterium]